MRRWQKAIGYTVLVFGALIAVGITATVGWRPIIGPRSRPLTNRTFDPTPPRLARGEYLTKAVTPCLVCHSEIDTKDLWTVKPGQLGAGQRWIEPDVPWVTAPNITPDRETGAGGWSDDAIGRAVREGIAHDGRTLFPMMPYPRFKVMSDEDLASIVVHIRTLRPVRHPLPPTEIPFPVNRLINSVPQPIEGSVPEPDLSSPEKRGKYIAALAVCEDCHTPRDDKNQPMEDMAFAGGGVVRIEGNAPITTANLTPAPDGISYYTEQTFVEALRTGRVRGRQLSNVMPWQFYRNMTDEDLKALFAYLKTVQPVDHYVDNALAPTRCPRCGQVHGGGERNKKAPASP
jgi:cytochrome c553